MTVCVRRKESSAVDKGKRNLDPIGILNGTSYAVHRLTETSITRSEIFLVVGDEDDPLRSMLHLYLL